MSPTPDPMNKPRANRSQSGKGKKKGPPLPAVSGRIIKLGLVLALLFGVWLYFFSGLFHTGPTLQVITGLQAPRNNEQVYRVTFGFNRDVLPDEVFVFPLNDERRDVTTVARAQRMGITPMWHMVTDEEYDPEEHRGREPRPVRSFRYGGWIRGLKRPENVGRPTPLEPEVTYRAIISDGELVGHVDFQTKPRN